ncbi:RsmB/NOP family class I SAM-dependent RNA methyltransferase [Bradyrhizobium sp. CCGUVB1N3]|uniref:RsmB/NOP family class I SAM-dependent RNA methyltransferase n=1 Tax=Bradyrhizobium sp. CCGUVB1N3 TaxID=2949629 RepID=UPI0020B1E608|nr:RsmB/NOP family class I SAM-dependent RNA methyltransferase [Bradyrhizobium sp. CCGUVB1N3]MCP3469377.1 RsmB/NOP family class I SAM-dependent RNA methyltransferase [Bradyrhizobium sp. CCGUVB1N3]
MTPAARLSAAIELIDTIERDRVPAAKALKEWGTAHRFAGSGDRAAIAGLVWDVLRRYASSAYLMDADTARARLIGMLRLERDMDTPTMAALFDGNRYAPEPLSEAEQAALASRSLKDAPASVAGDYPEWLDPYLAKVFGEDRAAEATAMASRAPLDLRVNTLKGSRDKVLGRLSHLKAQPTPWSPNGLRIELGADARNPGIQSEEDFIKGAIEVQDEGSQLAALFTAAKPGEQVIDLCAGAGGKTLALAALMQGKGRLIATDRDKRQLAPIHERLSRAGVHNAEIRTPKGEADPLADIRSTADLVVIDAPCTGTGTWRRNPDAKWRMRPGALEIRLKDQAEVLERAAPLVKAGGRIAYITCSVLSEENGEQVRAFVARHPEFSVVPSEQTASVLWDKAEDFTQAALQSAEGWLMTPRRTGTDGFFVSVLKKA